MAFSKSPTSLVMTLEFKATGLVPVKIDSPVAGRANVLVVQTNNATFARSGETYQQLAMENVETLNEVGATKIVVTLLAERTGWDVRRGLLEEEIQQKCAHDTS